MFSELRVQLPPDIQVEEARLMLAIKLYETSHLSLGQAAKLSGYSKPTFMELLGKNGVAVFNYPADELAREMNL